MENILPQKWSMSRTLCHGTNYSQLPVPHAILVIKILEKDPSFNTCHEVFQSNLIAPPTDLARNIDTKFTGVGAHSDHLISAKIVL